MRLLLLFYPNNQRGRPLFRAQVYYKGEPSEAFFIVLSGGVNVFSELDAETGKPDRMTLTRSLQAGATFGDRTLVAGTPTMESMVAVQHSLLAELSRDEYMTILREVKNVEVKAKMDFLCRQPAFAGLSFMEMREIEHMLLPVAFKASEELFVEGQKADKTYFILEGSVQVPAGAACVCDASVK